MKLAYSPGELSLIARLQQAIADFAAAVPEGNPASSAYQAELARHLARNLLVRYDLVRKSMDILMLSGRAKCACGRRYKRDGWLRRHWVKTGHWEQCWQ